MKKVILFVIAGIIVAFTSQFSNAAELNRKVVGGVIGAFGGALAGQMVGRDTSSTLIGSAIGTGLGVLIGYEMDRGTVQSPQQNQPVSSGTDWVNPDLQQSSAQIYPAIKNPLIQRALEEVPSGQGVEWQENSKTVSVVPAPAFNCNGNQICRDAKILVNGSEVGTFTGLRTQNGSWVRVQI